MSETGPHRGTPTTADTRLSTMTTLRLGGPARAVRRCRETAGLVEAITTLDRAGQRCLLVGGGSNLVVADEGFDGIVVLIETSDVVFGSEDTSPYVTAEAGVGWDDLVAATVESGFGGLECLSGIPGAAGATPVQNVGAYGVEVADLLRSVELLDRRSGERHWVSPSTLELGYRTSNLKHRDDQVVLAVSFWLNADRVSMPVRYGELSSALGIDPGATADAEAVRDQVLALRRGKGMVLDADDHDTWSAGSFFTNPIVSDDDAAQVLDRIAARVGTETRVPTYPADGGIKLSAGWLIERAGFTRGYPGPDAPARLSTKHTLALTNRGTARTADLLDLARTVRDGVHDAFGVTLHPEPVLVNCEL
ncbi:UDP-N-acetylmuramate dehydrogenase [Gordonia mangrovi]|uniref:UDP-N-acetylmuramate dehydrogenase n=1 Tax=Gordonia mangrovi TaxID=2665643 RepID=UPI00359FCCBB